MILRRMNKEGISGSSLAEFILKFTFYMILRQVFVLRAVGAENGGDFLLVFNAVVFIEVGVVSLFGVKVCEVFF